MLDQYLFNYLYFYFYLALLFVRKGISDEFCFDILAHFCSEIFHSRWTIVSPTNNFLFVLFSLFYFFCCACSEFITVNYVSLTAEGQFDSLNRIEFGLYLLFPIWLQNARSRCQRISLGFSLTEPRHHSHREPHGPAATVAPSWHGKQWKLHTVTASTKWFIKQS